MSAFVTKRRGDKPVEAVLDARNYMQGIWDQHTFLDYLLWSYCDYLVALQLHILHIMSSSARWRDGEMASTS